MTMKHLWRAAVLAALAGAGFCAPALAQFEPIAAPPPPNFYRMSRGEAPAPMDPDPKTLTPLAALQAQAGLDRYADCLVGKRGLRGKLDSYLRAIPGSEAMMALSKSTIDSKCALSAVGGNSAVQLQIRNDTMRDALFGALYRHDFGAAAPALPAELAPLSIAQEFDGPIDTMSPVLRGYRALGDCVVRADQASAREWVTTPFDSPAAKAAQAKVIPALQGCLTADQTLTVAPYALRGLLAEALYRLTMAARSPGSAVAAGKQAD